MLQSDGGPARLEPTGLMYTCRELTLRCSVNCEATPCFSLTQSMNRSTLTWPFPQSTWASADRGPIGGVGAPAIPITVWTNNKIQQRLGPKSVLTISLTVLSKEDQPLQEILSVRCSQSKDIGGGTYFDASLKCCFAFFVSFLSFCKRIRCITFTYHMLKLNVLHHAIRLSPLPHLNHLTSIQLSSNESKWITWTYLKNGGRLCWGVGILLKTCSPVLGRLPKAVNTQWLWSYSSITCAFQPSYMWISMFLHKTGTHLDYPQFRCDPC